MDSSPVLQQPRTSSTMLDLILLVIRAVQFLFAVIVVGLTGHGTSLRSPAQKKPHKINTPPRRATGGGRRGGGGSAPRRRRG